MKKEIKICLPVYKVVYSVLYAVILCLIRGVSEVLEIGMAMDANIALLAAVFCADTCVMERSGKRWEVFTLCPMKNKTRVIRRRLTVQVIYLCLLSYVGYFFFYWQKPMDTEHIGAELYGLYAVSVTATVILWSVLSMTLADIFRNSWMGIGTALVLWLVMNSKFGERALGKFNIFAYSLQQNSVLEDMSWLWGKGLGVAAAALMVSMIPWILRKRG